MRVPLRVVASLGVLLVLLSAGLAQTPDTSVFINLDPEVTRDVLVPPQLPLRGVLWTADALYPWSDDTSQSFLLGAPYSDLDAAHNETDFAQSAASFRVAGDFAVQAGLVLDDALYFWGSSVLYRLPDLANLNSVQASVTFPNLMLSRTGFAIGATVYSPQWSASGILPPQLFATDTSQYALGFAASTTVAADLVHPEMSASAVAGDYVFLGYNGGEIEVRDASALGTVLCNIALGNVSESGSGLQISELFVDATHALLYIAGTQEQRGWIGRLNVSDLAALNDQVFTVYDEGFADDSPFPRSSPNPALWRAFALGSAQNVIASNMAIDTEIGVGYANLNDQANRVSSLVKFDAVNMRMLGSELTPLQREDTLVVSMHLRNRTLYMATTTSIATFENYPTSCSNDCNADLGRGECVRSTCVCSPQWTGDACDEEACLAGCGEEEGRGVCRKGRCQCTANWTGTTCQTRRCPNDCSGHGTCNADYTCTCDPKYTGLACEKDKFNSCESLNEAKDAASLCIQFAACGWCFDEGVCMEGTRAGPANGTCRQWLVDSTYDIITVVFGAIIIFCFLVMFIINVISALMEDWRLATIMSTEGSEGDSMLARTQWWRDERSAKSWKLWDQLQFISYYSIINAAFSTRLVQFTGYFNWANFGLPALFVDTSFKPERTSQFVTASIEQYANAHGLAPKMVFVNALIWWLIATVALLVLYMLYYILVVYILRKGGRFSEILLHRVFHIITRALLAGYLPLVLLACFYIANYQDALMAVPVIFGLLIAVGVPVLNFLVVKGEKTDFLYYSLRIRFGAFYVSYQHTRTKFAFIVFGRKFLIAALVGFLATKTITSNDTLFWTQSLIPAGLMLVYIVLLVVFNPYIDLVHTILDIVLNLINIVTLATSYLHRSNKVDDKTAGVFVAMILQIAGLVFVIFAYLWTWLFYAGYTSPGQLCSGKPEADEEEGKKGNNNKGKKDDDNKAKKDDVKGVNETNLKDLEISESDS